MPKKKIHTDGHGNANENQYKPKKVPPKAYIQSQAITDYIRARDRVLYQMYPYLREELKEKYAKQKT